VHEHGRPPLPKYPNVVKNGVGIPDGNLTSHRHHSDMRGKNALLLIEEDVGLGSIRRRNLWGKIQPDHRILDSSVWIDD
jgi:hypothetical protein